MHATRVGLTTILAPLNVPHIHRLRPPLRVTWDRDPKGLVELDPVSNSVVAADSANRLQPAPAFQFDSVFGKDADQVDVYTRCEAVAAAGHRVIAAVIAALSM